MNVFLFEIKTRFKSFIIWTSVVVFMIAISIFLFPQMANQMNDLGETMAQMGDFSKMFGMDKISMGTYIGYFTAEIGTTFILGASIYAAMLGISIVSKEESLHTAETLYSFPIKRERVLLEKILATIAMITMMSIITFGLTLLFTMMIDEKVPMKELLILFASYYLALIFIALISLAISCFLRKDLVIIGIGGALGMYMINAIANIADAVKFLKYVTPFGLTNSADIVIDMSIEWPIIIIFTVVCLVALVSAFEYYKRKDIY